MNAETVGVPDVRPGVTNRAPTRADVARLAGVSAAVVSYTLNGGPKPVAAATAERVWTAVAQLGYTPNLAAQVLRRGSNDVIGVLIEDIANPFYGRVVRAIEELASSRGYELIISSAFGSHQHALAKLRTLAARQVCGIILGANLGETELVEATRLGTPIVQLDVSGELPGAVRIEPDLAGGAHLAMRHLFDLGHRSVAFLGRADGREPRHIAWRNAHRSAGLEPGPEVMCDFTREGGLEGMRALLSSARPTAVFAASDMIAIGALRAMRAAGLAVPDDISIASFDDSPEAAFAAPPLTTLRQPVAQMVEEAVDALLVPSRHTPGTRTLEVQLVVRESTGPPPV